MGQKKCIIVLRLSTEVVEEKEHIVIASKERCEEKIKISGDRNRSNKYKSSELSRGIAWALDGSMSMIMRSTKIRGTNSSGTEIAGQAHSAVRM